MNYKHLHYFMQVAESGSVVRASERLHLSPQTISGQIQVLEDRLGSPLFAKAGRRLELTDTGRLALDYARDIFALGAEFEAAMRDRSGPGRTTEFRVGVADAVPKPIAFQLLEPALQLTEPVRLECREWRLERLLADLALHRLDLVISDAPIPAHVSVKAYNHRLGSSPLAVFGSAALCVRYGHTLPRCLDGAPMLLPGDDSAAGQRLRRWFGTHGVRPKIVGEFDDHALACEFGRRGRGFFVAPALMAAQVEAMLDVRSIGTADDVEDEYFAISIERRITHPCVAAITRSARGALFASAAPARSRQRAGAS